MDVKTDSRPAPELARPAAVLASPHDAESHVQRFHVGGFNPYETSKCFWLLA